MQYDAMVVGGGMAGLTAAAYLARAGRAVLRCEKEPDVGGLVASFQRNGFTFDAGIRAIESSGIVRPMIRQLGIDLELLPSSVGIGIGSEVVKVSSPDSLASYQALLERQFPNHRQDVARIIGEVRRVMGYMDVLYGIDNPLFLDLKSDPAYVFKTVLPWLVKYYLTMPKVARLKLPVEEHLARLSGSQVLRDMIQQHFFQKTPAYFALSYFRLYLDYGYPRGGTGVFPRKLEEYIRARGGEIRTRSEIVRVDAGARTLTDSRGRQDSWRKLVWASDQKTLYRVLDGASVPDARARRVIESRKAALADKKGGDSVFTLFLALDLPPDYFSEIAGAHFFYTPRTIGLSTVDLRELAADPSEPGRYTRDRARLEAWTRRVLERTTYEISCPALRDPSLAPPGRTGLIVSNLMEHSLFAHVREMGWEEEYQQLCRDVVLETLSGSIFPKMRGAVLDAFTSTPLSLEKRTGNADGAITGWAFTNDPLPAVHHLPAITKSILTPIPDVSQAGQWTFSPAGLPVSILTGKLAADRVLRELR